MKMKKFRPGGVPGVPFFRFANDKTPFNGGGSRISQRGVNSKGERGANLSLPAATKLGQGNVFTSVCDSVHRGVYLVWSGGVYLVWSGWGTWSGPRGVYLVWSQGSVPDRHPPGPGTPPRPGTPPGTRYTPQTRPVTHPPPPPGPGTPSLPGPGTHPPDQVHPPGPGTPRTRYTPLGLGTPPRTRYSPQTRYTPKDQVRPPDQVHHPPPPNMANERPVRILLECILLEIEKNWS